MTTTLSRNELLARAASARALIVAHLNRTPESSFYQVELWYALKSDLTQLGLDEPNMTSMMKPLSENKLITKLKDGRGVKYASITHDPDLSEGTKPPPPTKVKLNASSPPPLPIAPKTVTAMTVDFVKSTGQMRITSNGVVMDIATGRTTITMNGSVIDIGVVN